MPALHTNTAMRYRLLTIFITTIALSACNGEKSRKNDEARRLGGKHASELSDKNMSDRQIIFKLLEIRANENAMRSKGMDEAADIYIKAFTDSLKAYNDSLASLIFQPGPA